MRRSMMLPRVFFCHLSELLQAFMLSWEYAGIKYILVHAYNFVKLNLVFRKNWKVVWDKIESCWINVPGRVHRSEGGSCELDLCGQAGSVPLPVRRPSIFGGLCFGLFRYNFRMKRMLPVALQFIKWREARG